MPQIIKYIRRWLLGLLLVAPASNAIAQDSYPVHATVQVLPPYGLHLSDYYSGTRDRLIVTLMNRDQGHGELNVKLKITIKNGSSFTLSSRNELYYSVITLPFGTPVRLTSAELAQYLAPDRVVMNGSLQNGKLPTGMTEFNVQAVDYNTGRVLSPTATGRAWLEIKQPPILDMPSKDEQIAPRDPQHIRFQWMPRHQGVTATIYQFTLKELPDNGAAPQSSFLYGNPVYQTETRLTTLNYTHLEPLLSAGKRYGWQVRAMATDGLDEIGLFENDGYSEVSWFQLIENSEPPTNVTAEAGYKKMTIKWTSLPEHTSFVVEYRPKTENEFYEWTSAQTFDNEFIAYELSAGWKYEYRVGAITGMSRQPVFSPTGEVTLPLNDEERAARCGMKPNVDLSNQEPKENLTPGDVVIIGGDFPMTLTQVSPQGNGWFSGKGWITMPWILEVKLSVKFSRLRVNTDNIQIDGEVESEYDPEASQIANTNQLDYGGSTTKEAGIVFGDPIELDFTIPPMPEAEYDPATGNLTIVGTDGEPHIVPAPKNEGGQTTFPMIVKDADGNKYQIDLPEEDIAGSADSGAETEDGTATSGETGGGKVTPTITPINDVEGEFDTEKLSEAAGVVVRFNRGDNDYAFDTGLVDWYGTALLLREYYKPFGKDYIAPWKLTPTGEDDTVEAEVIRINGDAKMSDISFVLKDGTGVAAKVDDVKWTLTLPSVGAGETYAIYAVYNNKGKLQTVGKLNVVSYPKQTRKVTLVPVYQRFDQTGIDLGSVKQELDKIFSPYGLSIEVGVNDKFHNAHDWEWDLDGDNKLNLNGSGFFSNETAEMKALRKSFQTKGQYTRNDYYLFVMKGANAGTEPDNKLAVTGDMPRGKQFGYLFMDNISSHELPRLIAHELGHGIFTLSHTFDVNYGGDGSKQKTLNLMDYANGSDLAAFQWNVMANPAPLTWFDSEEDAMAVTNADRRATLKIIEALRFGYAFNVNVNMVYPPNKTFSGDKDLTLGDNIQYKEITIGFGTKPKLIDPRREFVDIQYNDGSLRRFGFVGTGATAKLVFTIPENDIEKLKKYILCESAESWRQSIDKYSLIHLNALPEDALKEFTNVQRINILNKIINAGETDYYELAVHIISNVKDGHKKEFYGQLISGSSLIINLYEKISWEYKLKLVNALFNHFTQAVKENWITVDAETTYDFIDQKYLYDRNRKVTFNSGSQISAIQIDALRHVIEIVSGGSDQTEVKLPTESYRHAMWPVVVYFKLNESPWQNPALSGLKDGQILLMPAIYLAHIIDNYNKEQTKEMVDVVVTAASFASGAYGLTAAHKIFRITSAIELFSLTYDVTLNYIELEKKLNGFVEAKTVIESLRQMSVLLKTGVSITKIYNNNYGVLDAFADGYELLKKSNVSLVGKGGLTQQEYQQMEKLYQEIRKQK